MLFWRDACVHGGEKLGGDGNWVALGIELLYIYMYTANSIKIVLKKMERIKCERERLVGNEGFLPEYITIRKSRLEISKKINFVRFVYF
jgi:hypothetical protein